MKSSWQTKKIGDVCIVGAGNSAPQKKELFTNGKYPFFRTSDVGVVHIGRIDQSVDYLNENGIKGMRLFKKGTVLFPKSGASTFLNHRVIMGVDGYVSSHLATIQTKDSLLNSDYLFYFLQEIRAQDLIQDHKYPSLNLPVINNIEISYPELITEQKHTVKILDEVFEQIAKAKENAEKNLKNAKELFESYLAGVLQTVRIKSGEKRLGEVCESVEYGTSAKSKKTGKVAVLRMGNIQNGRIDWGSLVYTDSKDEINKYLLKYNDVLFNRTNSPEWVGKTAIYKGEAPAIFAGYLIRINRNEKLLDADYLNYFLNSSCAKKQGKRVVISSVNQANINGHKLKGYLIPLPPLTEQKTIVKKLDNISVETKKLEAIYKQKLADLEELKKSVLKKAFAGEL